MIDHLSSEQASRVLIGDADTDVQQHAATCDACAAEIRHLRESFALFRESVHEIAQQSPPSFMSLVSKRSYALKWAFAVAVLILIGIPVYQYQKVAAHHHMPTPEDAQLLEQVNAHLSRSLPAPLEPWMEMLSDTSEKEIGGRQ